MAGEIEEAEIGAGGVYGLGCCAVGGDTGIIVDVFVGWIDERGEVDYGEGGGHGAGGIRECDSSETQEESMKRLELLDTRHGTRELFIYILVIRSKARYRTVPRRIRVLSA